MKRLLLLIPTTSYRTDDFLAAARRLDIEVVVGSNQAAVFAGAAGTLAVDFDDPARGAEQIAAFAKSQPIDCIVPVDDGAGATAAAAAALLGLASNAPEAVAAARNKFRFREKLRLAGLRSPDYRLVSLDDDPGRLAHDVSFPCVLKPLTLAMSRGVIRADGHNSFVDAFHRVAAIIKSPDASTPGEAADHMLVESYIPGTEYALEGLIDNGRLHVLAIFDKPAPLEGPYFEETIYVTPAAIDADREAAIGAAAQDAVAAIGLVEGPTHIDLRVNDDGVYILEVDARSIGGHCGRSLRFSGGVRLEDVILRHAAGHDVRAQMKTAGAGGVMMIPIPATGILAAVEGKEAALAVAGVDDLSITIPIGQRVVMLPEGGRYLGFIIAHGATRESVVAALEAAHERLAFRINSDLG